MQPGAAYDAALEEYDLLVMPTLPMKATKIPPADMSREVYVQASVVERTNQGTLQGFVNARKEDGAKVYTGEHDGYIGLENHEVVKHSVGEYVKEPAHTNGIESFWSMLKRGYVSTYHQMSVKHLDRYVSEFAGRHNARPLDTLVQMECIAQRLVGKWLQYKELVA